MDRIRAWNLEQEPVLFFVLAFIYFLNFFFIVVLLQLSQFSPIDLPCPAHPQLPQSVPTLLSMSMDHLYQFLDYTLPLLSPLSHYSLPSVCCQSVPCVHVFGSFVVICLFCSLSSSFLKKYFVYFFFFREGEGERE